MDDIEKELQLERENSDRLAAALRTVMGAARDELPHVVIVVHSMVTIGHIADGALAMHDKATTRRIY